MAFQDRYGVSPYDSLVVPDLALILSQKQVGQLPDARASSSLDKGADHQRLVHVVHPHPMAHELHHLF
jgi:hypothetical protein